MVKVLIIGAGPVGLTLAHLLSKIKISTTILEQAPSFSSHPRAHIISPSSMEVFSILNLASEIYKESPPPSLCKSFTYTSSLRSPAFKVVDHTVSQSFKETQKLTDFELANFSQHKLVRILVNNLPSSVSLLMNKTVTDLDLSESPSVRTKQGEIFKADYVVACDGSRSTIQRLLNIPVTNKFFSDYLIGVHFFSKQLAEICLKNPALIYYIFNQEFYVGLIVHSLKEGEFILHKKFFPFIEKSENFDFYDIINKCAGVGHRISDIEIKEIKEWNLYAQSATCLRKGNFFLAGDAAHVTTPIGGFGLNLGIKDIFNLFWKFRFPETLDSYGEERVAHGLSVAKKSVENYKNLYEGVVPGYIDEKLVQKVVQNFSFVPFKEQIFDFFQKNLMESMSKNQSFSGLLVDNEKKIPLYYPKEDFQYRYEHGFFDKSGGFLAPKSKVGYGGESYALRLLPGFLTEKFKEPTFVKVNDARVPGSFHYPVAEVRCNGLESQLVRPDGIVYSKN